MEIYNIYGHVNGNIMTYRNRLNRSSFICSMTYCTSWNLVQLHRIVRNGEVSRHISDA
jgi:hypothetical protein